MTAIKWKSGATGDWNAASNWSPGAVPGVSDAVTIAAAGSYDVIVDDNESAQSVLLNSASATLIVEGSPNVVLSLGGNLNTMSGTLSLVADDTDGTHSIDGGTLTVGANGTVFVQPFQNGAQSQDFNVGSVANLAGKTSIAAGADLVFLQGGTIGGTCTGAGDLSLNSPNFTSTMSTFTSTVTALSSLGNWDVGGATLILPNGASGTFGGNVAATSSGTIVLLGNNTISVAGGLSVDYSGNLAIGQGSRITLPGQILLNNFGQIYVAPGATMSVSGSLQVGLGSVFLDNTYNSEIYGGGTLATQGATTIAYASDVNQLVLGEHQTWSNTGTCEVYANIAMNLVSQDTVTIVNQMSGVIDLSTNDANIIDHDTDGTDTLTNSGTLGRGLDQGGSNDNGTSTIAATVNSTGLIDVAEGTLAFSDGGSLGGTLSGNGSLLLYAGTFAIRNMAGGGILSVGSGAVATYAASPTLHAIYVLGDAENIALTATQTLTLAGGLIAGDTNGAGTITGGTLVAGDFATVVDGGAAPELVLAGNLVFENTGNFTAQGLIAFDAPSGSGSPTVSILNTGIFNFAGDDASLLSDGTNGALALTNTGTLTKTAGTGTSTLLGRVASTGAINVASGTLALFGGGTLAGTETGAGVLGLAAGGFTTAGLAGAGTLSVIGNTSLSETAATGTITQSILLGGGAIAEAAGKTATLSGPLTVSSGSGGGGAMGGPGTITTSGTTTVSSNPGTVQLTVYGGVTLNTTGKFNDAGEIGFNQYGSGTSDGATIVNTGQFILTDDDAGLAASGGSTANPHDVLRNTGTLTKSGGTGTSTIAVSVASTGPIAVNTGTLAMTAGGSVSGSLSGAGTLLLSGGTYTIGTINGPNGHLAFGPGVVLAGSPVIDAAFTLDGGNTLTIAAGHSLTEGGPFTIGDASGGGTITGPGTLVTTGATSIYDGGTNVLELALDGGLIWKNSGTVSDGGFAYGAYPGSAGGAVITNSGTFNFTSDDGSLSVYDSSAANTFTNTGTLAKTGGTATSALGFTINNTGTIAVAAGTLAMTGGGSLGGTLSGGGVLGLQAGSFTTGGIAGAGHLAVTGGSTVLAGTASGTVTASVAVSSNATLSASPKAAVLKLAGQVTVGDAGGYGAFAGPGTISTMGVTTVFDGGATVLDMVLNAGVTWANSGTVNDGGFGYGAYPGSSGGAAVVNSGTFNFTSDDASLTVYDSSATNIFTSTGTLAKTGGTATSTLGFAVNSTGVIAVAAGTLAMTGGGTVSGTLSGGGLLDLASGSFTTNGIAGAGHLAVTGGNTFLNGTASGTIAAAVLVSSNATLSASPKGSVLKLAGQVTLGDAAGYGAFSGPGTISTTGATTVIDGGATVLDLVINGGVTWTNAGTVNDGGFGYAAYPGSSGGAVIVNSGTFNFTSDDASLTVYDTSSANTFTNTGTLAKTGGTGTSQIGLVANDTGAVAVASGTLAFIAGGVVSGSLSGGGVLDLAGGAFTGAGLSGAGQLAVTGGNTVLTETSSGTIATSVLVSGNATLAVSPKAATLILSGPVTLGDASGYGALSGPGTISTTGVTTVIDGGANVLDMVVNGGVTWANGGTVNDGGFGYAAYPGSSGGATIANSGTFNFTSDDASLTIYDSSTTNLFINTGTLAKTGGIGTSQIGLVVNSTGAIAVASGTLALTAGGVVSGSLAGAGALDLASGTFTTTGLAGAGHLAITGGNTTLTQTSSGTIATALLESGFGTLVVSPASAVLTLSGPVMLGDNTGYGAFTGPGTVTTTGTTTVFDGGSGNALELGLGLGVTWVNGGTVNDAGLFASGTGGAAVVNSGTFNITSDDAGMAVYADASTFSNAGTLIKTGGTGTSVVAAPIGNTGTIEAAHGTLSLTGSVTGNGNLKIDAGATLDVGTLPASQKIAFTGGAGATLKMEVPASIGTLTNFTAGDRLDLVGTSVNSTKVTGNTLSVVTSGGTYTYVSAGIGGEVATTASDGNNGTFVSLYRAAMATHTPEPLAFGNFHVGSTTGTTTALTVTNAAPADGYSEKLNAGFGGASTGFTATGTVTGIVAGASNSTSLTAAINTGTAGAKSGTATLTLASNGAGVDGRGTTALPSQVVNLTGAVYNYAAGTLAPATVALGNQHVGAGASAFLTVTNTAPSGAYTEGLDAGFTKSTGSATGLGSVSVLAAGASNGTSLSVGLSPATAGAATGTETVTFVSDGAGTSGLGTTTLGTQTVSITGTYYNLAAATPGVTTIAFGNHHVGDTVAAKTLKLTNSAPAGGFSEALDAGFASATAGVTTAGTITGLAAGSSNGTSLTIGETAATAGTLAGSAVLSLVSDGTGIDGLGTTALPGQTITVTGANYNLASAQLGGSTVSLGVIHAATAASGAVTLTNSAPAGGYSESLDAGLSGASAGLSTSGSITGLAAGATDSSTLQVSVKTGATGAYSGTATLGLVSDGAGTSGLGTTTLTSQTVTVTATVDNYALAAFEDPSGPAITGTSTNATINLGSAIQGASATTLTLGVLNAAAGLADLLGGTLTSAGGAGFTNSGFGTFSGLSAGQDEHAQAVSLSTSTAGTFTETVVLSSYGTNASGYNGALAPETLTILGTVTASVFHTYTLALGPNVIQGADGLGDVFIARAGALNSRDQLTGGAGANSVTLAGAGLFDINAPKAFANIPTINATEGQAAMGSAPDTTQTVLLRDGVTETLNVAAGTAAAGNTNAETIAIYGGTGTDTIALAGGADQVFLGTGAETVTLGGAANAVTGGGGTALVHGTAAFAGAAVVGTSGAATTLEITTGGNITLNAADTYLTVQLDAASTLNLSAMSFITALGSSGADTLTAMTGTQTLTGGAGLDTLVGYSGGNDIFADTGAGLAGDTIKGWTTGDVIDVKDFANATLKFASNTLTITNGGTSTAIKFSSGIALHNFTVIGSDGGSGVLIGYHG